VRQLRRRSERCLILGVGVLEGGASRLREVVDGKQPLGNLDAHEPPGGRS